MCAMPRRSVTKVSSVYYVALASITGGVLATRIRRWKGSRCRSSVGANSAVSLFRRIRRRSVASTIAVAKSGIWRNCSRKRAARENQRHKTNFLQALALAISGAGAFCFSAESGNSAGRRRARAIGFFRGRTVVASWKEILPENPANRPLKIQSLEISAAWPQTDRFLSARSVA